jgi:uncharacterized Ntn-hydrolase superfamily protein
VTYSIVARDAETGELGVGVQTHQPCVGAVVPWVRPGVGAVATQASANVAFGSQALALLESGLDADHALAAVIAGDLLPHRRQVAVLDAAGRVAVHTGGGCIPFAGHHVGEGYSVQANMMLTETVPGAMARAFESTPGPLASRILASLEAAQAEGGDIRGSQSAAILVHAPGNGLDYHWNLRVDNDREPLARLSELVNIRLAGQVARAASDGDGLAGSSDDRKRKAFAAYEKARDLAPSDEQTFWFAVTVLNDQLGQTKDAAQLLEPLFARAPQWRELLHRLPTLERREILERLPRQ